MKDLIVIFLALVGVLVLFDAVRDYNKMPVMEIDHATKRCVAVRYPPEFEAQPCAGQMPEKFEIVWVSKTDPD